MSGCFLSKTTTTAQEGKYCCGREWENSTTTPSSNCTIQQSESYYVTTIIHGKDELMRNKIIPARQAYKYNDREQVRGRILC